MSAALSLACMAGNFDVVVALLGYGAAIYPHGPHTYFNVPPLYAAVQSDNLALCRLLLDWDSSGLDLITPISKLLYPALQVRGIAVYYQSRMASMVSVHAMWISFRVS